MKEHRSSHTQSTGGGAPLFDFSWGTGEVTVGEKSAAERGAAARHTMGAKRDRCKRGKSCGAACIFYRKDCVLELPVSVQPAVRAAQAYLTRMAQTGQLSEREAHRAFLKTTGLDKIEDKRAKQMNIGQRDAAIRESGIRKRVENMRELSRQIREESGSAKEHREKIHALVKESLNHYGVRKGAVDPMTPEQQAAMKSPENQAHYKKFQEIYSKVSSGQQVSQQEFHQMMEAATKFYHVKDHSEAEVNMFINLLPNHVRDYLLKKGAAAGHDPADFGTTTPNRSTLLPSSSSGLSKSDNQRANLYNIVKTGLDSNFRDIYTGLKISLDKVDLEHIIPENLTPYANMPLNRALTASIINQIKSNGPFTHMYADSDSRFFGATGLSPKRKLLDDLDNGIKTAQQTLANIGSLPKGSLDAKALREVHASVVSKLTDTPVSVNIGRTGGTKNNTQGWYIFGGKESSGWDAKASTEFGQKMANKLAQWEGQGPAGTAKIAALTQVLAQTRRALLDLNNQEFPPGSGNRIRDIGFAKDKEAKKYVQDQIGNIMKNAMPTIDAVLDQ